jgi:mono/diheme cytochrome c family protein
MKKLILVVAGVGAIAFGQFVAQPAYAQKQYLDAFKAKHADFPAAQANCLVCHGAESKKVRNDFGKEVAAALGGTKVKDVEKINAALATAEGKPSAVAGKTFGDLIKEGKLPASK